LSQIANLPGDSTGSQTRNTAHRPGLRRQQLDPLAVRPHAVSNTPSVTCQAHGLLPTSADCTAFNGIGASALRAMLRATLVVSGYRQLEIVVTPEKAVCSILPSVRPRIGDDVTRADLEAAIRKVRLGYDKQAGQVAEANSTAESRSAER
jgi:hypothetical protein